MKYTLFFFPASEIRLPKSHFETNNLTVYYLRAGSLLCADVLRFIWNTKVTSKNIAKYSDMLIMCKTQNAVLLKQSKESSVLIVYLNLASRMIYKI